MSSSLPDFNNLDPNTPIQSGELGQQVKKKKSMAHKLTKVFAPNKSSRSSSKSSKTSPRDKVSPRFSTGATGAFGLGNASTPPTPDLPMPDDADEIEQRFLEAIEQLGIQDEEKRKNLIDRYTSPQLKWKMVIDAERSRQVLMSGKGSNPEYYLELFSHATLQTIMTQSKALADEILHLNVHVRNQQMKWLHDLLSLGVLEEIVHMMATLCSIQEPSDSICDLTDNIVTVLQSIMNTRDGVTHVIQIPYAMRTLVSCLLLDISRAKSKSHILLLLTLFASFDNEGLNLVLDGFSHAKLVFREKYRFELLVQHLIETSSFDVKINGMMLLNTLMNYSEDMVVRSSIQTELINLDTMKRFANLNIMDADFVSQLQEFETELKSDLSAHFDNSNDPAGLARLICGQLGNEKILVDILNDMLSLSNTSQDYAVTTDNWNVLYSVIHSLVNSTNADGRIKDMSEEDVRLRSQIRTFENAMKDVENKLKVEKQKIIDFIDRGIKPSVADFEILKELLLKTVELKEKSERAVTAAAHHDTHPTTVSSAPASSKPLPVPPSQNSVSAVQQEPIMTPPSLPPSPPNASMSAPPPPPMGTGGMAPPPPPPMGGGPPPPPPMMGGGPPPPPGMGGPPPPPGMGGPPMPPGMMGGGAINLPKLPTYTPKVELRNFHIESIAKNKVNNTIFVKNNITEATNNIKLDTAEIEELFSAKKVVTQSSGSGSAQPKAAVAQVSLIDPKRAYNVGIQLASMRLSHETIKVAIVQMNKEKLSANQINILKQICPTEEEIEAVTNYEGSVEELAAPDRFFRVLSSIPHLEGRLEAWGFRMRFDDDVASLRPNIESLRLAAKELKESEKFTKFLTLVLAIGNYLNAKGSKKNAYGFKLGSLQKLKDTKTTDGKSNLLAYIIEFIEAKHPNLAKFYTDLPNVSIAKKIGIVQIKETIANMKKETTKLAKTISLYEGAKLETEDRFLDIMKPFYSKAVEALQGAESKYEALVKQLEELAVLYDEDKNVMINKPEDFFSTVDSFFELYQATQQQLAEKKKKEEEKKKKDATRSMSATSSTPKPNIKEAITKAKNSPPANEGLLNDLKANMKNGEIFAKRRTMRLNSIDLEAQFAKEKLSMELANRKR